MKCVKSVLGESSVMVSLYAVTKVLGQICNKGTRSPGGTGVLPLALIWVTARTSLGTTGLRDCSRQHSRNSKC